MAKGLAIIFKAGGEEDKDSYARKLEEIGFVSRAIPVLTFEYVNLEELKRKIEQPVNYAGIIFSSPRVVEAVKRCSPRVSLWSGKLAFAVGEKTADDVRQLGLDPLGSDAGIGAVLADHILSYEVKLPLLLPCGNLSSNAMYDKLQKHGVNVERIVVYQTIPDPRLDERIQQIVDNPSLPPISVVLYFSPSGVNATMPIFKDLGLNLCSVKFGAIGPTTEAALSSHVPASFVAEKPTPEHFALALEKSLATT